MIRGSVEMDYGDPEDWDERSNNGSGKFHDIENEYEREISLGKVVDLEGKHIAQELDFEEDSFIQNEPLKDAKPNDEWYTGFTGNEGITATQHYHRTVRILYP